MVQMSTLCLFCKNRNNRTFGRTVFMLYIFADVEFQVLVVLIFLLEYIYMYHNT